jgi:hypothetical protein
MRELDDALDRLHHDTRTADVPLDAVRARVLAAAANPGAAPERARRVRWFAPVAVAAAAALIAGVVAVHNGAGRQQPQVAIGSPAAPTSVEPLSAQEYLTQAADAITATDQPLEPGQYRYVAVHEWRSHHVMTTLPHEPIVGYAYLVESRDETWIPQDVTQEWMNRRTPLEGAKWLGGTMPQSEAPLPEPDEIEKGERRGRCGDFFSGTLPPLGCGDPDDWHNPEYYARLPRDPQALLQWLRDHTADIRGVGVANLPFAFAVRLLRTGLAPADLRASLYRALALIDGVTVTDGKANLNGRVGVAIALDDLYDRIELIVDPTTGDVIGERIVAGPQPYMPYITPGTTTAYTAVTTKVVDGIGETD